jgi:hypothetical protein
VKDTVIDFFSRAFGWDMKVTVFANRPLLCALGERAMKDKYAQQKSAHHYQGTTARRVRWLIPYDWLHANASLPK